MSKSCLHLHFLLVFLFCCEILASRVLLTDDLVVVPFGGCSPDQIKALMEFKSEFDSSGCNDNEFIGVVECNIGTGYVTMLQLRRGCFSGALRHNSSLFKLHQLEILDLSHNDFISSSLPSKFGSLNKLQELSLSFSGFTGQVPSSFNNLTQLTDLDLSYNQLTGNFPVIYNLTKLSFLSLYYNNFSGTIPSYLFNMPLLEDLNVQVNCFTGSIQVPNSSFPSSLKSLRLADNNFEPQILEPISKLIKLELLHHSSVDINHLLDLGIFSSLRSLVDLDISENSLSPASLNSDSDIPLTLEILGLSWCNITEFPSILKTLVNLQSLDISNNRIKGKIPEWLWNLPSLRSVNLCRNSLNDFDGSRADILVNSSLQFLDLQVNFFKGPFPNPPLSINILSARGNSFTGSIPLSVCNCKSLTHLYLPYNNFTGPVPHCLSNLTLLSLRKNNLEGSLPDIFYVGSSLRTLDIGFNRLTGKLPRSLLNCSYLRFISVENNRIQDTFPFWLKALPDLQVLILRSNKMYGPISTHDQGPLEFPALRILEIPDNNFTGSLLSNYFAKWNISSLERNGRMYLGDYQEPYFREPYYIYMDYMDLRYKGLNMEQNSIFTFYNAIDFSGNRFEGKIPESIGLLKALTALNLSNNAFTGDIPPSLANVTELQSLDLSRNQLSGNIPNGFKTLSFLAYINVSHNQLKGDIPQGTQIIGQPKSCFEGNAGLCGLPLKESCADISTRPIQQHKQEDEDEDGEVLNWKAVAIGYCPGLLFGLAIAQVIASYKPEWFVRIYGPSRMRNR